MHNYRLTTKLSILFSLILALCMATTTTSFAQERQVTVFLNGSELSFDVPPMIVDGFTYVPMRTIFEAHGAIVTWDDATKVITASQGDLHIVYPINGTSMYLNGAEVQLGLKSMTVNNRTLVPLRFISEALGSTVVWEDTTKSIYIRAVYNKLQVTPPLNTTITMTSQKRSNSLFDFKNNFNIFVEHYGIQENQLYSQVSLTNSSDQDIYVSLAPSDKKIIRSYSKKIPPGTTAYEAQTANGPGIWMTDGDTIFLKKYIHNSEGALQELLVPAHQSEMLTIIAAKGEDTSLIVNGSYHVKSEQPSLVDFKINYAIEPNLELGTYKLIYTFFLPNSK